MICPHSPILSGYTCEQQEGLMSRAQYQSEQHMRLIEVMREEKAKDPWRGWVHGQRLAGIAGNRYGARLNELRDDGWQIEKKAAPGGWYMYRLTALDRGSRREPRVRFDLRASDIAALARGEITDTVRQEAQRMYPPQRSLFDA